MIKEKQVFSDDDVVRSVREGNTRNFETLIDRYKNKIINFIHKMIYDYDEAQSLSQDVFLKVFETIKRYQMRDNFQAFIFTIAKNITLNHIKKQKRVLFISNFASGDSSDREYENKYFQEEDQQQTVMEKAQQEEIITAALKTLNENQRIALIMKVYLEFSYNQITEITGWSIPKIETLISRAKSSLKDQIRDILNKNLPKGGSTGPMTKEKKIKRMQEEMQEKNRKDVLRVRTTVR